MQAFSVDRDSQIPVRLQLQAQVRYQIAAGLLYPGDRLPALRDLATGLGVNLNTVIRAVDELEAEGFLYSHQGKGVFVADDPPAPMPGAAMRSLLAGVLGQARDWSLSPEELALAVLAQGQLARTPVPSHRRLLLVGTARADLRPVQRHLEAALPSASVVAALPEEVRSSGAFKVVVATLFHGLGLTPAPGGQVVLLAGQAEQDELARVKALPGGTCVAVAAGDLVQAARIRQSLEPVGLAHLRFMLAVRPADLDGAAYVLAAPSGRQMAKQARPDLPLLAETTGVTAEALSAIRRMLGAAAPEQRVQLRSSWV